MAVSGRHGRSPWFDAAPVDAGGAANARIFGPDPRGGKSDACSMARFRTSVGRRSGASVLDWRKVTGGREANRGMGRWAGPKALGGFAAVAVLVLAGLDQLTGGEPLSGADFLLDVFDKALLIGVVLVIVHLSRDMRGLRAEQETIRGDLRAAVAAGEAWRELSRTHIEGLSAAIARQFDAWQLTAAEAEIAGLMLKGMSLREIAAARRTGDTTIRQQAAGIYRKSGLSGRAELSAYFLDSLSPLPALRAAE